MRRGRGRQEARSSRGQTGRRVGRGEGRGKRGDDARLTPDDITRDSRGLTGGGGPVDGVGGVDLPGDRVGCVDSPGEDLGFRSKPLNFDLGLVNLGSVLEPLVVGFDKGDSGGGSEGENGGGRGDNG